jgi:hypothetical protein
MALTNRYFNCFHRHARYAWALAALLTLSLCAAGAANAREIGTNDDGRPPAGWSLDVQGAFLHQLDTDIDDGGSFSVNRFFVEGGPRYTIGGGRQIGLSFGYGYDDYGFSGSQGFAALRPWDDIHSLRISLPVRWRLDRQWSLFASPTMRFTAESGADINDSLTGGVFAGVAYRVNDRLSIGPGIGVLTQLEDSASVIPVLVVNWKMTDTLTLSTGRGFGATLGPGIALSWKPVPKWEFSFGGRAESLRFRLDKDGKYPGGIGDDRAFPLFCGAVYSFSPRVQAGILVGAEVGGELRLEDKKGRKIAEQDHDTAGFLGISVSARF